MSPSSFAVLVPAVFGLVLSKEFMSVQRSFLTHETGMSTTSLVIALAAPSLVKVIPKSDGIERLSLTAELMEERQS